MSRWLRVAETFNRFEEVLECKLNDKDVPYKDYKKFITEKNLISTTSETFTTDEGPMGDWFVESTFITRTYKIPAGILVLETREDNTTEL